MFYIWLLFILNLSFLSFTEEIKNPTIIKLYKDNKIYFPKVEEIKIIDFIKDRENFILVDVRSNKEIKISKIPQAISKKDFEKNILKYKDKKIAVYCTIGYRSAKYISKLERKGIKAFNLEGSILGWIDSGHIVINHKNKETKKVHVYGKKWDLLPKGYVGLTGWFK